MPNYVYLIEATGVCGLTGETKQTVRNSVVFRTAEAAGKRVEKFKQACIDNYRLSEHKDMPIKVEIFPLEIIEE